MAKITSADFKYYQNKLQKDKNFHREEFMERINPLLIDSYYEGYPTLQDQDRNQEDLSIPKRMSMNSIFPATSTLVAQFYPQNPKFVGYPKREGDELAAKVSAAAMNYYYDQMGAIKENQKAIISAWMYGFGVTKQGWRTDFRQVEGSGTKESSKFAQLIRKFSRNPAMEEKEDREYIASEGPFLEFVNGKNIYFDCDQPFGKWRFFHQHIPKNLHEIATNNLYSVGEDFVNRFRGAKDDREVILDLYESWIWLEDGLYVLVSVEGWNKPIRWEKTPYVAEGFPYKVLALNNQVNRVYPVSHMKVAQRLQRFSDYILTLEMEHIKKHKNITVFDGQAFDDPDKVRIKKNELGLNVFTKQGKPAQTSATHVGGNTIPVDLFNVQDILRKNIKEILTVVGARQSGESETETATQERIADFGNQLRASGMTSQIKDFLVSQGKKLLQDLKQFGTAPALIKVTGLNLVDPETNMPVTEKMVEFATNRNPELLKDIIPTDLDIGIDISNTQDRNLPVLRRQLNEFVQGTVLPLAPLLAQEGKKFNAFKFIKKAAENFETIDNADEFFDNVSIPEEGAEGGLPPEGEVPEEVTPEQSEVNLEGLV